MWIKTCLWVRSRLPLLAGGDSLGLDRRVIERHLLRCAGCRHRLEALQAAQAALLEVASTDPLPPADASPPSLWPALARQIRESRRPRPARAFDSRWDWAWPVLGLACGLLIALAMLGTVRKDVPVVSDLTDASLKSFQGFISRGASGPVRLQKEEVLEAHDRRRQAERDRPREYSFHAGPRDERALSAE